MPDLCLDMVRMFWYGEGSSLDGRGTGRKGRVDMIRVHYYTVDGEWLDVRVTTPFNAETVRDMLARQFRTDVVMVVQ